jgi:hypothetical protein
MKILRTLRFLVLGLVVSTLAISARADSTNYNFNITVVNPADNVSNLIFLYTQGDVVDFYNLSGDAAAGTSTTFAVSQTIDLAVAGTPSFAVIGTYGQASNPGVYVAVNGATAANLVTTGATFASAFPVYSALFGSPEATLADAIRNPDTDIDSGGGTFGAGFGYEIVGLFDSSSEYEARDPFTALNLTGTTSADFLGFSQATLDGTVSVSVLSPGGSSSVPEPGSGRLLELAALALVAARFCAKARHARSRVGMHWSARPLR